MNIFRVPYYFSICDLNIIPQIDFATLQVVDSLTGYVVFNIFEHFRILSSYNFELELKFVCYQYKKIAKAYPNTTKLGNTTWKKCISSAKYCIEFIFDIDYLHQYQKTDRSTCYLLTKLIMNEIKTECTTSQKYAIEPYNVKNIIKKRNNKPVSLYSAFQYKLNNKYIFNAKDKTIVLKDMCPRISFARSGGLIETNDVERFINESCLRKLAQKRKTVIFIPSFMKKIWNNDLVFTYEDLIEIDNKDLKAVIVDNDIEQIIVHELYEILLPSIKKLINNSGCKTVWVINSLPIRFYFDTDVTEKNTSDYKLSVDKANSICNIWAGFSNEIKSVHNLDIIRFVASKFNKIYSVINYDINIKYEKHLIKPQSIEIDICNNILQWYWNWMNKLENSDSNKYSSVSFSLNRKLERQLYEIIVKMFLDITNVDEKSFTDDIEKTLMIINLSLVKLQSLSNKYTKIINGHIDVSIRNAIFDYFINNTLENEINRINKLINKIYSTKERYTRYLDTNYQNNEKTCPICYSEDSSYVKIICGHTVCIDCIFNVIRVNNSCPICKELINCSKIKIDKKTVRDYSSDLINYLQKLDEDDILVTDISLQQLILCDFSKITQSYVVELHNPNLSCQIMNIKSKYKSIHFLVYPERIRSSYQKKEFNMILNYIKMINNNVKITVIEMDI